MNVADKAKPLSEAAKAQGARIRALREYLKLTQDEVAERAGVKRVEVVHTDSGRNQLTTSRMQEAIARGLGLPPDWFMLYARGAITLAQVLELRREDAPPAPTQPSDVLLYNARKRAVELLVKRDVDLDIATRAVQAAIGFEQPQQGWRGIDSDQLAKMAAALIIQSSAELPAKVRASLVQLVGATEQKTRDVPASKLVPGPVRGRGS